MGKGRKSNLLVSSLLLLFLFTACGATLKEVITSNPPGANIYSGKTKQVMSKSGQETPVSRKLSASMIESWCYQVKKDGYQESEIICRPDEKKERTIHFELKPTGKQRAGLKQRPLISETGASTATKDYQIGSGDILEIVTWKEEDFTKEEVIVRVDGKITFPLLDDLQAAGLTPIELKNNIEKKLTNFVDSPEVTVTVRNPGSQKFYILGEVMQTGEYPLIKNLTVLQAFALAGGFTEWASKKEIILFRRENGHEKTIRINYKDIVSDKDFSQNVKIKANDTIIVP